MHHPARSVAAPIVAPVVVAALLATAPGGVTPATAQEEAATVPSDPGAALERARKAQRDFELFRASRIPVERERREGRCDQRIGRICIWYGGADEARFPPEPPETDQARRGLIGVLLETHDVVKDPWVVGQLVHYAVEQGDPRLAERIALECEIDETWWCHALLGYSRQVRGAFVDAEAAFRDALAAMPAEERARWDEPVFVLTPDGREALDDLDPDTRRLRVERLWRFSDPLFLVEGNDRLTEHWARLVQLRNREDAGNPQDLEWDVDLAETLVRYGRMIGWSRTHQPGFGQPGPRFRVRDTRRVVGHHHPGSRGYLFPEDFLEAPAEIPPESWITAPREAWTWYAPAYAPDFRGLDTQLGRFRRGEEMLVVAAYRPSRSRAPGVAADPFDAGPDDVEAALFLVPEDGGAPVRVSNDLPRGVVTLRAPTGRWVGSMEVFEPGRRRAWRARQGVTQEPLVPGLVAVSDLLVLEEGAPFPESLDDAIPHVRQGITVRGDERVTVVWEVYGLRVAEPVEVTVGFTRGRPGFLERVGDFLGILEPEVPVEIAFSDAGPDRVQAVFRALELELPEVEPGEYTLHVRLELRGREPVVTSRPIVVVE